MVVKEYNKQAGVYKVQTFRTTQRDEKSKRDIYHRHGSKKGRNWKATTEPWKQLSVVAGLPTGEVDKPSSSRKRS
jgi:hypothetical protein